MMRKFIAGVFALILGLSVMGPVSAQESSPEALAPVDCTVEPIDPAVYNEAVLASVPPLQQPVNPEGEAASDEVAAAATEVILQSVACTNAGDFARLLAVIDPMYAPTLLGVPFGDFEAALIASVESSVSATEATPMVDDIDQAAIEAQVLSVTNVLDHGNGVVSAVAELQQADGSTMTFTIYLRTQAETGNYVIFYYAIHNLTTPLIPAGF